ncbi:MAG: hypothetical protein E7638_04650 [Ruminococcaceae bacterium]|nr:hypothetical protein [Oscillospiraceae bacterium]
MPISFKRENSLFKLTTKNTLYAFDIVNGALVHRYYGKKFGAVVKTHAEFEDPFLSFAPYRTEETREFSRDNQTLEYSYFGNGDFRTTSLRIKNGAGNSVTDFLYVSHKIRKGRVDIPSLPCAKADEATETLDITLRDAVSGCDLHLYYTVFYDCDVISRYASVTNKSGGDVVIEKWMSLMLDLDRSDLDIINLAGDYSFERGYPDRTPVTRGNYSIQSRRGASSHQMNPFIAVCDRKADENRGDVYGFNLVYSGSFLDEVEGSYVDEKLYNGLTRVQLGLGSENFSYRLRDGETVFCPEAVMTYSPTGLGTMSRNFHRFINKHIVPEEAKERRPVVLNSWEAFYFDIDENLMVDFAKAAADCNIDMVVMDDGWFGKRTNDEVGLGDWYENRDRFRDGLAPFVKRVKETGVKFGIWVEPEMVNPGSELFKVHPEWCVRCPDRHMSLSRSQYVLDMANPAVVEYLKESFKKTFDGVDIDYFKWDFNRHISEPGSLYLEAEDQGSMNFRFMQGVYSLFKWFRETYPNAMIETCSGGGGRYDLGMMAVSSQIWTSDETNPRHRTYIQYGSLIAYPASVMSCHVNKPRDDMKDFALKYKVAVNGVFGYEFNILNASDAVKDEIRRQIKEYRTFDTVITKGDHYRLASPYETGISAYYFQLKEDGCDKILMNAVLTDGKRIRGKKKSVKKLIVRTADAKATYRDRLSGITVTGEELKKGFDIGEFEPDGTGYDAKMWFFVKE